MKFLIVANGPFLSKNIISEAAKNNDTIVALDGACDKLAQIGIMPQIILGDFDSIKESAINFWGIKKTFDEINEESKPYIGNYNIKIVPAKDQDLTDLTKAIRYCDANGATSIDIICAIGGDRMDHTIASMRGLRAEYKKDRCLNLLTEGQVLTFAKNQTVIIKGKVKDYCGIVAAPAGKFTSEGLAYNGNDYKLEFGYTESISNQLVECNATVHVVGEVIIIHPPQLNSQRDFLAMNQAERLHLLYKEQKT